MIAEIKAVSFKSCSVWRLRTNGSLDRGPHIQPRAVGLMCVARTDKSDADNRKYHGDDDEREDTAQRGFPAPLHLHALEHSEWYGHDCQQLATYMK